MVAGFLQQRIHDGFMNPAGVWKISTAAKTANVGIRGPRK
jgi:hypothetical protein